jgi:hypothetical protein
VIGKSISRPCQWFIIIFRSEFPSNFFQHESQIKNGPKDCGECVCASCVKIDHHGLLGVRFIRRRRIFIRLGRFQDASRSFRYAMATHVDANSIDHCNSIDHSKPPIQPLAKVLGEKLSISQETTPRAPRIDMGSRRRVSHDEDMFKIDEGTVSSLLN